MGEIGEIVFRSWLFDEKHMLEATSYLSFAVCGFGGLPCHAAQSVPRFAIIPLSMETGFLTWNTWMASVSSAAKKTLLALWKPPKHTPFLLSLSRDLIMDVGSGRLTHVHTETHTDDAHFYFWSSCQRDKFSLAECVFFPPLSLQICLLTAFAPLSRLTDRSLY